ncbi:hypothetical protein OC842_000457 [Tilletia horrida]|uniref:Uncharacterized protein n=1 Tax=Tilletia horrida TaxID=155126 RepID=A0AAN6GGU7_9BASI|nr:hypothetical protein OC842_000457 [Tilletia horrida]
MSSPQHIVYLASTSGVPVALNIAAELLARGYRTTILATSIDPLDDSIVRLKSHLNPAQLWRFSFLEDAVAAEAAASLPPSPSSASSTIRKVPGEVEIDRSAAAASVVKVAAITSDSAQEHFARLHSTLIGLKPDLAIVDAAYTLAYDVVRTSHIKWALIDNTGPALAPGWDQLQAEAAAPQVAHQSWFTAPHNLWRAMKGIWSTEERTSKELTAARPSHSSENIRNTICSERSQLFKAMLVLMPPGLHLHRTLDAFDQRCFFVGAVANGEHEDEQQHQPAADTAEMRFLDQAYAAGDDVVLVDLSDVAVSNAVLLGIEQLHTARPNKRFLVHGLAPPPLLSTLVAAASEDNEQGLPLSPAAIAVLKRDFLLAVTRIGDVGAVLRDPSVKAVIHGGGRFGDALAHELPQLLIPSQLSHRSHELGLIITKFNLGLTTSISTTSTSYPYKTTPKASARAQAAALTHDANTLCTQLLGMLAPETYDGLKASVEHWALRSRLAGGAGACADVVESIVGSG